MSDKKSNSITGLGLREKAKGGWHPKGKESWRSDNRGINQVAGWIGKGKSPAADAQDHVSRPLSTLKDPSSFGPPPKNVNYHGGAALPNQITPDTRGFGVPLSQDQILAARQAEEQEQHEATSPPPVPYRMDKTGLYTAHLPPPPGRRDAADGHTPTPTTKPKPPGLPPRLPARQISSPSPAAPPPPLAHGSATTETDAHKGVLNQGSIGRLGAAGISVPGFGIGGKPPPTSTSSPAATASSPQLNELQSRFSRLSSSISPQTDNPKEGTTFAQKQAALKTASAFRNDPSSISLSDARSAASTANNFRERHGEQIKSGWASANKFNSKYGLTEKVGSYGGIPTAQSDNTPLHEELTTSPKIEMRDNKVEIEGQQSGLGKKKPPPLPKKRSDMVGAGAVVGAEPPPVPLASKPNLQPTRQTNSQDQADLDLDLKSLWFAKSPPTFPPSSINRLPGKRSYTSSSSWSSSGVRKTHTFVGAIRDNSTLATTKIRLTWDASNPSVTVKSEQRRFPPPRKLGTDELELYRRRYSGATASWCLSKMGQQVGNGECWTLAHDALFAVASKCSSNGEEPCMTSQSLVHGYLIYSYLPAVSPYPEPKGGVMEAGVARGDVIQFLTAHFKAKNGVRESFAGAPDHTAVIDRVEANGVLMVLEQNTGGVKLVREGRYDMSELVKGEVRIFRAVGESWAGKLDAMW